MDACRSCGGPLIGVLDLGDQHLSDFPSVNSATDSFPLRVVVCNECSLAQLDTSVPRELMYHERYGFKSGVNDSIRANHFDTVERVLEMTSPRSWLDIACNDGTLLSYVPKDVIRWGVDPVTKYAKEATKHADQVINDFFDPDDFMWDEKFDVITTISMFYDIEDLDEFVAGVASILATDGLWVIQQNYLADTLRLHAVDNICHEHLTYFSLLSLEPLLARHGLYVNSVDRSSVNGGSFRTFVSRKASHDSSVEMFRLREAALGLSAKATYKSFAHDVSWALSRLRSFVEQRVAEGATFYVYGASTRGGTLFQSAGIGPSLVTAAVDRNPEKVGRWMASLGIPIISEEQAREDHPDYMLVSPWFFRNEFVKREKEYIDRGGKLVIPLPSFEVVG